VACIRRRRRHSVGPLHQTFPPEEARRIASRLEIVLTPKYGSWPDMTKTGTRVLSRQCLDRWIPDQERMKAEVAVYGRAYRMIR